MDFTNDDGDEDFSQEMGEFDYGFDEEGPSPLALAFMLMHEHFQVLMEVGFTEVQALRFLALCTVYGGEDDE